MDSNLPAKRAFRVLDCTPFDECMTIVYLRLLIHSRVLPLAWRVMPAQQQWSDQVFAISSAGHHLALCCALLSKIGQG
jgi:hypothetical protein